MKATEDKLVLEYHITRRVVRRGSSGFLGRSHCYLHICSLLFL